MTQEQFVHEVSKEQRALRRFLLALCCGDRDRADDIAQEALVKAWLSIGRFDGVNFSGWLKRIAYNAFIDNTRSADRYSPLDDASAEASGDAADDFCRYQDLYQALDWLSPKERTAILLYYLEGYAVKEICKIVDCSEDAVKQQLSRGRRQLKELL